jgi:hypothetical protein
MDFFNLWRFQWPIPNRAFHDGTGAFTTSLIGPCHCWSAEDGSVFFIGDSHLAAGAVVIWVNIGLTIVCDLYWKIWMVPFMAQPRHAARCQEQPEPIALAYKGSQERVNYTYALALSQHGKAAWCQADMFTGVKPFASYNRRNSNVDCVPVLVAFNQLA